MMLMIKFTLFGHFKIAFFFVMRRKFLAFISFSSPSILQRYCLMLGLASAAAWRYLLITIDIFIYLDYY